MSFQPTIFPETGLRLVEVPFKGNERKLLQTHYSGSTQIVGRRVFYAIFKDGMEIGVVGLQGVSLVMGSVARAVYGCGKITTDVRKAYLLEVMNNNVFRLEQNEANLASKILAIFRDRAWLDIRRKYGQSLRAIISLTFGTNAKGAERTGICYKADNWKYLGMSKGFRKTVHGIGTGKESYQRVDPKHVWLYVYSKRDLRRLGK